MGSAAKRVLDEALQLPADERAELVARLIDSLEDEPDDDPPEVALAWQAEIERRVRELDEGTVETIRWEDVRRGLESASRSRRPRAPR
ncbi:MAG: addiction module protein [Sandaracinaceae bacterium]|nr:addiction module protein [Sandaracinaceae bacterium]